MTWLARKKGEGPTWRARHLAMRRRPALESWLKLTACSSSCSLRTSCALASATPPQPLELARHRRIRQQLPRLYPECSYLRLTVSALLDYRHYFGRRKSRIPRDLLQRLQHLVTVLCSAQQACEP